MNKWEKKHTVFSFAIVILLGLTAYLSFTYPTFEKVKSFELLKINTRKNNNNYLENNLII